MFNLKKNRMFSYLHAMQGFDIFKQDKNTYFKNQIKKEIQNCSQDDIIML